MATNLGITDGTTTVNLNDTTNYVLMEYTPTMAALAPVPGRTPYLSGTETLTILVRGSSRGTVRQRVQTIAGLVLQAQRFGRGEPVAAVRLTYRPDGSAKGSDYEALILGPADGDWCTYDIQTDSTSGGYLTTLTLRILIQLPWLNETDSAATASANTTLRWDVTGMTAHTPLSPCVITLTSMPNWTGGARAGAGWLVASSWIGSVDLSGGGVSSTLLAASNNILERTALARAVVTLPTVPAGSRALAVWVVARYTSGTYAGIQGYLTSYSGAVALTRGVGSPYYLQAALNEPEVCYLGVIPLDGSGVMPGFLELQPLTSNTIQFDMVYVAVVDSMFQAVALPAFASLGASGTLVADAQLLTQPGGTVYTTPDTAPMAFVGRPSFWVTGTGIDVALIANEPTLFGIGDAVGTARASIGVSVVRRRAYLVPE